VPVGAAAVVALLPVLAVLPLALLWLDELQPTRTTAVITVAANGATVRVARHLRLGPTSTPLGGTTSFAATAPKL